ncbi:hypothetical protein Q5752_004897 [Cryptotrichosporon argae]
MTSMAAALAASLPAPVVEPVAPPPQAKIPTRMEGFLDVEAARDVDAVQLSSLAFLKILKHSTDVLPPPPAQLQQTDRNAPPPTALSARPDATGVLLGLDLDGVMEVEDCFALPAGETSLSGKSYAASILPFFSDVNTPDTPVGVYLSTHNGGFVTRAAVELVLAVERAGARGRAVLVVHDAARADASGDVSVKAYRLSEGAREAAKGGKWDNAALVENKLTAATLLSPLPLTVSSPSTIRALLSTLTTPASSAAAAVPSLASPAVALPPAFQALVNPLPHSLPAYLGDTLDALTLHAHEANNLAFMTRQIGRERARHDAAARERDEENARRRKQGLAELAPVGELRGGTKEPSRLEMLCLQGQVDGLAKSMGAEAGKGLVRCYL